MGLWIPLSFKITADGDCSHEIKRHLLLGRKVMTNMVKSLSRVRLFETPWTVAYQAPPSMGFSSQEYWSGLPQPRQHIKKQRPYFVNTGLSSDGISVELFHILKDDAVKVMHSICQQIWKTQRWPQNWKRSVFITIPKKGSDKECSDYRTIALISHTSKLMLKILQANLQQYVNHELPDGQAGFRKARVTRDQIANIRWIIEKAREFQKNIYFCFIDYAKAFDCVDHNQLWKILRDGNTR